MQKLVSLAVRRAAIHQLPKTRLLPMFSQTALVPRGMLITSQFRLKSTTPAPTKFVPEAGPPLEKVAESKSDKLKALMKDYGPIAAVIYFCLSTFIVFATYGIMKAFGVDAALLEQKYKDARVKVGYPVKSEPADKPKEESLFVKYLGLDPVTFGVAFVITTPLFPLELAATVFLAKKLRRPVKPLAPKKR